MFLWSTLDTNYLYRSWSVVTIKWNLILTNWQTVQQAIDNIDVSWDWLSWKPSVLSLAALSNPTPSWSWLFISSTHMWYYSWWQWKTYMQSNGNFWLSGSWSNYLTWDWNYLTVRWDIRATSATFNYAWSSSAWWSINKWFNTNDLDPKTAPSTWVKIDNTWIKMYSWWVEKVSIWADWNATFAWNIWASTITAWWKITTTASYSTSTQTVTVSWWQISFQDNLYNRNITINWPSFIMRSWWIETVAINQNTSWTRWGSIQFSYWWNLSWVVAWRDNWLWIWTSWKTVEILWKLKIPVWSNLYE